MTTPYRRDRRSRLDAQDAPGLGPSAARAAGRTQATGTLSVERGQPADATPPPAAEPPPWRDLAGQAALLWAITSARLGLALWLGHSVPRRRAAPRLLLYSLGGGFVLLLLKIVGTLLDPDLTEDED